MDFTTNEWAFIALILIAGWLLGLMSRSGGGRWKTEYEREREAHVVLRRENDALRREHDTLVQRHPVADTTLPGTSTQTLRSGGF